LELKRRRHLLQPRSSLRLQTHLLPKARAVSHRHRQGMWVFLLPYCVGVGQAGWKMQRQEERIRGEEAVMVEEGAGRGWTVCRSPFAAGTPSVSRA